MIPTVMQEALLSQPYAREMISPTLALTTGLFESPPWRRVVKDSCKPREAKLQLGVFKFQEQD